MNNTYFPNINYKLWLLIIIIIAILLRLHLVYLSYDNTGAYFTSDSYEYLNPALNYIEKGTFGDSERNYGYPTFLLVLYVENKFPQLPFNSSKHSINI